MRPFRDIREKKIIKPTNEPNQETPVETSGTQSSKAVGFGTMDNLFNTGGSNLQNRNRLKKNDDSSSVKSLSFASKTNTLGKKEPETKVALPEEIEKIKT